MKRILLASVLLLLSSPLFAGGSNLYFLDSDWRQEEKIPVSIVIVQDADFVSVPVTITSNCNDPELRNKDISEAMRLFIDAAQKNNRIKIDSGIVYLSTQKTSFFKSYGSESQAKFNLLVPFDRGKSNVYNCADEIYKFIETVKLPDKAKCNPGGTILVVDNPEKYRSKLLQMIYDEIKRTKEIFKTSSKIIISGLENPVSVKQIDEQSVKLFIKYTVSMEIQ